MAIDPHRGVSRACVGLLLDEPLSIPSYQRPYRWTPETALALLDDILEHAHEVHSAQTTYVLGAVILHRRDTKGLDVVDGQQRLLTLTLILDRLTLRTDGGESIGLIPADALAQDPPRPIVEVWNALDQRITRLARSSGNFSADHLADFIRTRCLFVRIETDDLDEAFRVFDSQNYRGKSLVPHDLLKAHHLRAMKGATEEEMGAVVEKWHGVSSDDLNTLFSTYLWRIHRWSRGQRAPRFTTDDIATFKGLTLDDADTPSGLHYLSAHEAIDLDRRVESTPADLRLIKRARHQLDAPLIAGRPFFEMVEFLLAELREIRRSGFDRGRERFASSRGDLSEIPSRSQYRYVSELYLAALLYFINKFGDETTAFDDARYHLFRWSFALRTRLKSVRGVSIDKLARGDGDPESAFVLLRNATSPRDIRRLTPGDIGRPGEPGHMSDLVANLTRSE